MNYKEDKPWKYNPKEPEGVSKRFYFDLCSYQNLVHDYLNGEVKKVIHAKWEQKEHWVPLAWDASPWSYDKEEYDEKTHSQKELYWHCSNCGYEGSRDTKPLFKFCPNCGAEMNLEEN